MIGIFDSGIGGLTVVRELIRQSPDASFVYLGDTARVPYGNKSRETIVRYAIEDAAFLVSEQVTSIVIACNTASTVRDEVERAFPSLPIFDVIAPAVEEAVATTNGRVGVIGTRATIGSGVYQQLLQRAQKDLVIFAEPCPLFVPLVEEGWVEGAVAEMIVEQHLGSLKKSGIDTLILGCTHYPFLAPVISRYLGSEVSLVDSARATVAKLLSSISFPEGPMSRKYFLTDVSPRSVEIAQTWLGEPVTVVKAEFIR